MIEEYRVGLVTPASGINDAQLAEVALRLRFIEKAINGGRIVMRATAPDLAFPEELPRRLTKELQYRATFALEPVRYVPNGRVPTHEFLWAVMGTCDETWICTAENEGRMSMARGSSLWRYAQEMAEHRGQLQRAQAIGTKLIPAWVSMPDAEAQTAKKFGKKKGKPQGPQWREELRYGA